jgi:hypothetical protein
MIKLIAFCGAKESGKSTSAEILKSKIVNIEEVAFAGHLKKTCAKVFNIDIKYFLDTALKEKELDSYYRLTKEYIEQIFSEFEVTEFDYDKHVRPHMGQVFDTPRKILQYVGTELLQPIDKLIHVNYTLRKVNPDVLTVFTDLRFPHEFDSLATRPDFLSVYVDNLKAEQAASSDSHASERGWQKFKHLCVRLDNNKDISWLMSGIQKIIEDYKL